MNFLSKCILKFSINKIRLIVTFFLVIFVFLKSNSYCFETASFKRGPTNIIEVPSNLDLTKLPRDKIYKISHSKFVLQFFFNNRDIFGFILKRKHNFGIMIHLCFFRSCAESAYDNYQVITMPQDPPPNKTFFSVKFPQSLRYDFQGIEFLAIN